MCSDNAVANSRVYKWKDVDKKFLNVNIIKFEKVEQPKGGWSDNVDKYFLLNLDTFWCFFFTPLLNF